MIMNKSSLAKEIKKRINRFQRLLRDREIDGALIVQKVDLYYLTGTDQDAHLWISASNRPLLMVRKSLERAQNDAAIEDIVSLPSLSQLPEYIKEYTTGVPFKLGLELDVLPVNRYFSYQKLFPGSEIIDISSLIRQVRMIKSAYEISCIRKAVDMADRLYQRIPEFIHTSDTEMKLASKAEAFYRKEGHPGVIRMRSFNLDSVYGHIMAGPSATTPSNSAGPTGGSGPGPFLSQGPGFNKIGQQEPIIIDYTGCVDGYLSDQARIFSIGKLDEKFCRAPRVMLDVQEAVAREGRPGVKAKQLYALALEMVEKAGLGEGFMGHPQPVPFIAHGLGLELDEWPLIGSDSGHVLEKGMTIALEPKYIFPGEGVVGIENTFVVTDKGMEKLNRFPDEISTLSSSAFHLDSGI